MVKIKGFIPLTKVRIWLENYPALDSKSAAFDTEEVVANSGPKEYDGITGRRLAKIMIDEAIGRLPEDLRVVVKARWLERWPLRDSLVAAQCKKSQYYRRCDAACQAIHKSVNGLAINYQQLFTKIQESKK